MAKQTVNLGTMADNKSGDPLRTAFEKINENFDEVYTAVGTIPTDINQLADADGLLGQGGGGVDAILVGAVLAQTVYSPNPNELWVAGGDITSQFPSGTKFYIAGDATEYTVDFADTIYSFTNVHIVETFASQPQGGLNVYTTVNQTPTTLMASTGVLFDFVGGRLIIKKDPVGADTGLVKVNLQNQAGPEVYPFTMDVMDTVFVVSQNGGSGQAQVTLPSNAPSGKIYTVKFTDKANPSNLIVIPANGTTIDGSTDPIEINKNNGYITVVYDSGSSVFRIISKDLVDGGSSTVTKTAMNGNGVATALSVTNNPNPNWINGNGIYANGISFAVQVTDGVATVSSISDGGTGHYIGETFGPVVGSAFGGTDGVDDMYFQVDSVQPAVNQALDLTKTINKITPLPGGNGSQYTLADGVEGQIMYIVPASASGNEYTTMSFDHARWSNGNNIINEGTNVNWWLPFHGMNFGSTVITLIFTDGAWNLPHNYFD